MLKFGDIEGISLLLLQFDEFYGGARWLSSRDQSATYIYI